MQDASNRPGIVRAQLKYFGVSFHSHTMTGALLTPPALLPLGFGLHSEEETSVLLFSLGFTAPLPSPRFLFFLPLCSIPSFYTLLPILFLRLTLSIPLLPPPRPFPFILCPLFLPSAGFSASALWPRTLSWKNEWRATGNTSSFAWTELPTWTMFRFRFKCHLYGCPGRFLHCEVCLLFNAVFHST